MRENIFSTNLKCFILTTFFLFSLLFSSLEAISAFDGESSQERMEMILNDSDEAKKLYSNLKKLSEKIKKPFTFAENHLELNRYSSHLPYDDVRCCREIDDFYISASDVTTPMQTYIMAQAPIPTTVNDFWKMILYKKCTLIASACMPEEMGKDRCTVYWVEPFLPKKVLDWEITFISEKTVQEGPHAQKISERNFSVLNVITLEERIITQLHFENWPDCGIPDFDLFQTYLDTVDAYSKDSETPILVHCSVGIGRSGTFVASHSLKKELYSGSEEINIPQRVYDIRTQRRKAVSNAKQLQFIYKTLLYSQENVLPVK